MKTLILPICILLFTACSKSDMPEPAITDVSARWPSATERRTDDTLAKVSILPFGKGPVPAEKDPVIKKP